MSSLYIAYPSYDAAFTAIKKAFEAGELDTHPIIYVKHDKGLSWHVDSHPPSVSWDKVFKLEFTHPRYYQRFRLAKDGTYKAGYYLYGNYWTQKETEWR